MSSVRNLGGVRLGPAQMQSCSTEEDRQMREQENDSKHHKKKKNKEGDVMVTGWLLC
jgi:hypothetical protein